jgi:hypothetical protein
MSVRPPSAGGNACACVLPPQLVARWPVQFYAFDPLYSGGTAMLTEPYERRRAVLEEALGAAGEPRQSPYRASRDGRRRVGADGRRCETCGYAGTRPDAPTCGRHVPRQSTTQSELQALRRNQALVRRGAAAMKA